MGPAPARPPQPPDSRSRATSFVSEISASCRSHPFPVVQRALGLCQPSRSISGADVSPGRRQHGRSRTSAISLSKFFRQCAAAPDVNPEDAVPAAGAALQADLAWSAIRRGTPLSKLNVDGGTRRPKRTPRTEPPTDVRQLARCPSPGDDGPRPELHGVSPDAARRGVRPAGLPGRLRPGPAARQAGQTPLYSVQPRARPARNDAPRRRTLPGFPRRSPRPPAADVPGSRSSKARPPPDPTRPQPPWPRMARPPAPRAAGGQNRRCFRRPAAAGPEDGRRLGNAGAAGDRPITATGTAEPAAGFRCLPSARRLSAARRCPPRSLTTATAARGSAKNARPRPVRGRHLDSGWLDARLRNARAKPTVARGRPGP